MLGKIKEFFKGAETLEVDKNGQPSDREIQIACAVLLLEMAGADNDYSPAEVEMCLTSIQQQFKLSREAATEPLEIADGLRKQNNKVDEFVKIINENYNDKQRTRILAMVWKVVIADGAVEKFELRFATQMKFRLKLDDAAADRARKMAESRQI